MKKILNTLIIAALIGCSVAYASDSELTEFSNDKEGITERFKKSSYSPYAGRNFPTNVYFGDTHVHTSLSGDAFGFGNKIGDEDALRFARGEEITSADGLQVKLSRPLDFLVVADHAEAYGTMSAVYAGESSVMKSDKTKRWHKMLQAGGEVSFQAVMEIIAAVSESSLPAELLDKKFLRATWENHTAVADQYDEPGVFTSFNGYEWSSHPGGNNLHRVVIFRDNADKVNQVVPFSTFDSGDPEDLWTWMQRYEDKTGGSILAIPHNGNLSSGMMFDVETLKGKGLTNAYAQARMRWEPLAEVTQIKGDGETHSFLVWSKNSKPLF